MSGYQMDGTRHVSGEAALWQELCEEREKNARLRGLVHRGVWVVDMLCECLADTMQPGVENWLDDAKKELAE